MIDQAITIYTIVFVYCTTVQSFVYLNLQEIHIKYVVVVGDGCLEL